MVVRLRKVSFGRDVASVAQLGLHFRQQELLFHCLVRPMAVHATHPIAGMGRAGKVPLLVLLAMTSQAARIRFLLRERFEADDLAHIAAARHMRCSRPMARFATMTIAQGGFEVCRPFEVLLINVGVAHFSDIAPPYSGGVTLLGRSAGSATTQSASRFRAAKLFAHMFMVLLSRSQISENSLRIHRQSHNLSAGDLPGQRWREWIVEMTCNALDDRVRDSRPLRLVSICPFRRSRCGRPNPSSIFHRTRNKKMSFR